MESLTIEIDENGKVVVHIQGVKGKGCESIEKAIADALGKTVKSDKTSEYYAPAETRRLAIAKGV